MTLQESFYQGRSFGGLITSVLDGEPRHAQRGVRPECQEEAVTTALYPLWGLVALETREQRPIRVFALIDVQEVVTGLHVEAERKTKAERLRCGNRQIVVCVLVPVLENN